MRQPRVRNAAILTRGGRFGRIGVASAAAAVATDAHSSYTGLGADDHTQYVTDALVNAIGDLLVATAADTVARIGVGANNTILVADSTQTAGMRWA